MRQRDTILTELRGIVELQSPLSSFTKSRVEELYLLVYGVRFHRTSCSDCYHDAAIKMYLYLKKGGNMAEKEKEYLLRRGMICTVDGKDYTRKTLTDELARKYLKESPDRAKYFEKLPKDWKTAITPTVKAEEKPTMAEEKKKEQTKEKSK